KPLVTRITDSLMEPFFFPGDVVGAESVVIKQLESAPERILKHPCVIEISPGVFAPRILCKDADGHIRFYRTIANEVVAEIEHSWLGRIVWMRRSHLACSDEQAIP